MTTKLTIEEKYPNITEQDHVMKKDMWAGTKEQVESTEFIIAADGTGKLTTVKYSPAWMKCIDEPIVNALDQFVREPGMKTLRVNFDTNGAVCIYNDGPGIEVALHKQLNVYVPQIVFGMLFKGSNINNNGESIVGGTNGVGAKISNIFATEFTIETVDVERELFYKQTWKDHMKNPPSAPTIIPLAKLRSTPAVANLATPHTSLTFKPDYEGLFGYTDLRAHIAELTDVVRTRVYMAAVYGSYCAQGRKCRVYFNDVEITCDAPSLAAKLFPGASTYTTIMAPTSANISASPDSKLAKYKYPWQVTAVIMQADNNGYNQLSNVNGVVVRQGRHTKKIYSLITDAIEEKIVKVFEDKQVKFNKSYVTSYMFLIVNAQIPCPAWTGQRKDEMDTPMTAFANYVLDPKFTNQVAAKLKDHILIGMLNQKDVDIAKTSKLEYDKYIPAANLRNPFNEPRAMLLAAEGDSANEQIKNAFRNVAKLNNDRYGFISLGGVIMNARREIKILTAIDGSTKQQKSRQLMNNALFKALIIVLGLNLNYKYDPASPTYKREIGELKYSCIVGCVDQDYDGIGNIFSLLASMFEVLWPNLYKIGFVKRFATPIQRAYPKSGGKVLSFYSDAEYDEWCCQMESSGKSTGAYRIYYYKGLGSHSREESIKMVENFHDYLMTYYLDDMSHTLFDVYYGNNPELRKRVLSKPTDVPSREKTLEQLKTRAVSCSDHLSYLANIFQKDNIERHLDSAIDGFNQSTRKIYHGAWLSIGNSKEAVKVAQLAGDIAKREDYHHGENVLGDSLKKQAFVAVGGKQLPIFVPFGNFGTRSCGGKASASVRYVKVKFNAKVNNLLYPPQDYELLEFTYEEGNRSTPKYFVPIIPTGITESNLQPGHGWQIQVWAKDAIDLIRIVQFMIKNEVWGDSASQPMVIPEPAYYTNGWTGRIIKMHGKSYSVGKYRYEKDHIYISELPYRTWTNDYISWIKDRIEAQDPYIESCKDNSNDKIINICIRLRPGAYDKIHSLYTELSSGIDPIIEYFKLRDSMSNQLNLIGAKGEVIEFGGYADVIKYWFPLRRDMYYMRMDRIEILLELEILMYSNVVRYIKEHETIGVSKRKLAALITQLETLKFDKIYKARLLNPDFTPTGKLRDVVLGADASYDYLIDLTDRSKTAEELAIKETKLGELTARLEALRANRSANKLYLWEEELARLQQVITEGIKTSWTFGESGKYIL